MSPESERIFDLILAIQRRCDGDFESLFESLGLSMEDMHFFLDYAAMFLNNMGNCHVSISSLQLMFFSKKPNSPTTTGSLFLA